MKSINSYEILHKRGVGGEIRVWSMELGQFGDEFGHRVISGVLDGKMVESGWTTCSPKNVGRSNETTAETQAIAEIEAEYRKKKDRGYFEDIDDVDTVAFTKPMLASDWEKLKAKIDIDEGVVVQPKLDGIRCIARADGLWTRTGKPITSCDHVFDALRPLFEKYPDLILDGELYNHELRDDFNTITSVVRKAKVSEEDQAKAERLIQYHVYDYVDELDAVDRANKLVRILSEINHSIPFSHPIVKFVTSITARSESVVDEAYDQWIEQGYEGQIVRLRAPYEHKRSKNLLKRKDFLSDEFEVVRVEEGNGNWAGMVKRFVFLLPDGRECGAGVRGTQAALRELLESGKTPDWATVRFFTPTPDGMPRFPVVVDYGWGQRDD